MKFICEECAEPCILEVGDGYNLTADVLQCVCKNSCYCKWKEFKGNQPPTNSSQSVTNCNRLPKLTAEVFNRPDCPEWAEFAAVDGCGRGFYYEAFPRLYKQDRFFLLSTVYGKTQRIPGKFDGKNWINSIIARLKKPSLPDWCKPGAWIYTSSEQYLKINGVSIDLQKIELSNGATWSKQDIIDEAVSARLRPYNAEEMRGLVGEVLKTADGDMQLITSFYKSTVRVVVGGLVDRPASEILEIYTHLDGSPCGVLEHLENGEWVR